MSEDAGFLNEYSLSPIVFSIDFNICYYLFLFFILTTNNFKDSSYLNVKFRTNKIQIIPY